MRLVFVTGNKGKVKEASARLAPLGVEVDARDLRPREIQADTLEEVALDKLRDASAALGAQALMLDDGGLFVRALKDFPGVYSSYVLRTIGVPGVLKLMEGVEDRSAEFRCVVAFWRPGDEPRLFKGVCPGRLARAPRSDGHGFGFDPIFIPEGDARTFAEIPTDEKNRISHRGRALDQLVAHLRTIGAVA
jgi:XTP/dITP diphosphohydrolase